MVWSNISTRQFSCKKFLNCWQDCFQRVHRRFFGVEFCLGIKINIKFTFRFSAKSFGSFSKNESAWLSNCTQGVLRIILRTCCLFLEKDCFNFFWFSKETFFQFWRKFFGKVVETAPSDLGENWDKSICLSKYYVLLFMFGFWAKRSRTSGEFLPGGLLELFYKCRKTQFEAKLNFWR